MESDSVFIQKLIRDSQKAVAMTSFDPNDLLAMPWKDVLDLCKKTSDDEEDVHSSSLPPTPRSPTFDQDEKIWLSQIERVQTTLFDGKVFSRHRAQPKTEVLTDLALYERRINKNRRVYDKTIHYYVSKESTLCKYGEAVPTITDSNSLKGKESSKVEFKHLKFCVVCGRTRKLDECLYCPRSYHEKCVNRQKDSTQKKYNPFNNDICPYHWCTKCGMTASNAGGLLLSCNSCPRSFCIDCIDLDEMESIEGELPEFLDLGYESPRHIEYITCGDCMKKARKEPRKREVTSTGGRVLRKRVRRHTD
ncbi:hypothetical protein TSTA_064500 [Talaromyces stipitatus ATCC 10500]|uniref:Zinc finger PHD-type domain-containing protein n=1 Tax=Talaromyces stipitatus (strain ATCC 10500 / CBS 375.48 / QM 6759 / NRRL 1006) TaxID=441959 RepID=B8LSY7_TALSN|nr:uncharacterized protein TSTA_064500 [Talaromyces stipitatus ATCC 10500]EED22983.1 hypothetical protein TSTA_064500 [Talaromyces stipitatus ATCC 10500]